MRKPHTHYERDRSVWKEVTEAGLIVFQYQLTPKGQELLRDAPSLIGSPVRALRPATSPIDTKIKPLKIVTYDRPAIQKLVRAFDEKATTLIEKAFSPRNDLDRAASANRGLVCGPRLWKTLEPHARRNGHAQELTCVKCRVQFLLLRTDRCDENYMDSVGFFLDPLLVTVYKTSKPRASP